MVVGFELDRTRGFWLGMTAVLGGLVVLVLHRFVGTFVLGLFIYYAARPLYSRLRLVLGRPGLAAFATLFAFELPFLAVTGYLLLLGLRGLERYTGTGADLVARVLPVSIGEVEVAIADPVAYVQGLEGATIVEVVTTGTDILGPIATFFLHLTLAIAIAFYLLRDGESLAGWLKDETGEDSTVWLYATLVDRDLQVVYFGNIRTVVVVGLLGMLVYNGLNAVAPAGLGIPIPNVLAILTGAATLIPVVVGKVVYVPLAIYLGSVAVQSNTGAIWFPVTVAIVSFFALDLLPIMIIRPYFAGRSTHRGLMMFSYIFGGLLFGWYGIFLGPLLLIATIHLVRVGFSELAHGDRVTADVTSAPGLGSMPRTATGSHEDPDRPPDDADATVDE